MTWFKIDDGFYDHPKVFDAPDCAIALWIRAGCWAARNLTDGKVPSKLPARLCDDPSTAVQELLDRGLWTQTDDGYEFHDWHVYQPSAAKVKATRAARAEAGSKGGKAKAANGRSSKLLEDRQNSDSETAKQKSAPTRPDPEDSSNEESFRGDKSPTKKTTERGTRLPEDFPVTEDMKEWARREAPNARPSDHEKFCDYWRAQPGRKAVKLDWVATWRNWMRKADEESRFRSRGAGPGRATTDQRMEQADAALAEVLAELANGGAVG